MKILEENYYPNYDTPVGLSDNNTEDFINNNTEDLINMTSPVAKANIKEHGFDLEVGFNIILSNFP